MTSEGTSLYNLDFRDKQRTSLYNPDFRDKQRDLTLQSWLQWQVKGPHFTGQTSLTSKGTSIYNQDFTDKWRDLILQSTEHEMFYRATPCSAVVMQSVTLHRKAQPFLALAGKQALVHCSARLQENLGARITKQQSTSNLFSQQHLSHTITMYVTYSNNKNIHTKKQDPQNIHC